jgi:hypothetical protein
MAMEPPPPVVPRLPEIQAYLAQAKTFCEDKAHQVKEAIGNGKIKAKGAREGENYYTAAKASFDASIAYTCMAMQRGFTDNDEKVIFRKLNESNTTMMAFMSKADSLLAPGQFGAANPLDKVLEMFPGHKLLRKKQERLTRHACAGFSASTSAPQVILGTLSLVQLARFLRQNVPVRLAPIRRALRSRL